MQLDCLKLLPYLNKWRKLMIIFYSFFKLLLLLYNEVLLVGSWLCIISVDIKHFDSIIIHKIFWLFMTRWLICKLFELCWFMILDFHCTTNKQGQTANVPVLVTFDYACLYWFHFHFHFRFQSPLVLVQVTICTVFVGEYWFLWLIVWYIRVIDLKMKISFVDCIHLH